MKYWDNRKTSLFLVTRNGNKSLSHTTLRIIEWDGRATLEVVDNDILFRNASVTLEGVMPNDIDVFSVPPNAQLNLVHNGCGPRDKYVNDYLVLVMENITHEYRAIRNAAIVSITDASRITLEVVFRCDVRLVGLA